MTFSEIAVLIGKYVVLPFIGGLIGAAIKGWIESRRLFRLENARSITGRWEGELRYLKPGWESERIEIEFHANRLLDLSYWFSSRLVKGTILSNHDPGSELFVRGGFYQSDQLMLDYRSLQVSRRQFGSLILSLDASGQKLNGNFIDYFDEPLTGTLMLQKQT